MLVSVVIPAFNRERTIRRAVESILNQTYAPVEIIVVDDGSTDHTAQVVAGYGRRVTLIRQANAGPSAARNAGIRAANGAIIAFLDSDDAWAPDKLARQIALLRATSGQGVSCCICNATMLYADGTSRTSFEIAGLDGGVSEGVWTNPAEVLVTRFLLFNQVVAVWRPALDEAGLFASDLRIMEDHDLALRLAAVGPWAFVATPLVTWHGGAPNSLSHSARPLEIARNECEILSRFRRFRRFDARLEPLAHDKLRRLRWRIRGLERSLGPDLRIRASGRLMLASLRAYEAWQRRRSSYPQMVVEPVRRNTLPDTARPPSQPDAVAKPSPRQAG